MHQYRNSLKYWRQERLISQIELANLTSIPRSSIQLAEQGVTALTMAQAEKICVALGIDLNMLSKKLIKQGEAAQ